MTEDDVIQAIQARLRELNKELAELEEILQALDNLQEE